VRDTAKQARDHDRQLKLGDSLGLLSSSLSSSFSSTTKKAEFLNGLKEGDMVEVSRKRIDPCNLKKGGGLLFNYRLVFFVKTIFEMLPFAMLRRCCVFKQLFRQYFF
jgi:hypothetical protein